MTFPIPQGVTSIKVYTYCNEHDLWVSDAIDVG
jgi:desulfoferrodoxin (superoxide reductase-like protein)